MIDLSPETEALARRLAEARRMSVDAVVRHALTAAVGERLPRASRARDASAASIARRRAAFRNLSDTIASLPILDTRPVQDIIDDINAE